MRKRPVILPYKRNSMSAKTVSRHFGTLRIFPNRNYKPRINDVIINWGFQGEIPVLAGKPNRILNNPINVANAASKVSCLNILKNEGVPVPEFTTSQLEAANLFKDTDVVFCRTLTRASKGKGIVLANNASELVKAPLYTAKLENEAEYRVHVFDDKVLDIVQKRRMTKERLADKGIVERNDNVRNLMNGWSFTRGKLTLKDKDGSWYYQMIDVALEAARALNLDFCAIDLVKTPSNDFYVLEINTAPGMKKGTTTHRRYIKAISDFCEIPFDNEDYTRKYQIEDTYNNNLEIFLNTYYNDVEN